MLTNVRVVCSELTGEIKIARFGKRPNIALEHRPAEAEVFGAIVTHMMDNAPKGSIKKFTLKGKRYTLKLYPD